MCRQNSPVHNSAEDEIAADESLLIYCKPVEYYNIIYRRFLHNVNYIFLFYISVLILCFCQNLLFSILINYVPLTPFIVSVLIFPLVMALKILKMIWFT